MSRYEGYFLNAQKGGRISDIGDVYRSSRYLQRGRGIGDVFSGMIKWITPYLLKGTKALGQEALRSGSEILSNMGTKPLGELVQDQRDRSIKNLSEKAGNTLKRMSQAMGTGSGVKRRKLNTMGVIDSLDGLTTTPARKKKPRKKPIKKRTKKVGKVRKKKTGPRKTKKKTQKKKKKKTTKKRTKRPSKTAFLKSLFGKKK